MIITTRLIYLPPCIGLVEPESGQLSADGANWRRQGRWCPLLPWAAEKAALMDFSWLQRYAFVNHLCGSTDTFRPLGQAFVPHPYAGTHWPGNIMCHAPANHFQTNLPGLQQPAGQPAELFLKTGKIPQVDSDSCLRINFPPFNYVPY
jgi:hypothetical protein